MGFITFITANVGAILAILGGLLAVAGVIAKLTPTPKDDAVIEKLLYVFNLLPQSARDAVDARKAEADKPRIEPIFKGK